MPQETITEDSQGEQPQAKTASEALRSSAGHWADHAEMPLADVHTLLLHPGMADLHGLQKFRLQLTSRLECTGTHQGHCGALTMQMVVMRLQDKSVELRWNTRWECLTITGETLARWPSSLTD